MIETLQSSSAALTALTALLGLLVGSFLNVVIYRLPRIMEREWRSQAVEVIYEWAQAKDPAEGLVKARDGLAEVRKSLEATPRYNLVVPRSACPACGHRISASANIPLLSWLYLRGRCSGCGAHISARYPIVEALTGVVSGYVAWRFGFSLATVAGLIFAWALIALTFIDLDTMYLPDDITLLLLWAGLLFNVTCNMSPTLFEEQRSTGWAVILPAERQLAYSVIGAIGGYLFLWSVYWVFKLVTGKEGMGFGDFKLLAAIGGWFGWISLLPVILISSLVGAIVGIALILFRKHAREKPIPFGPYLAAAGLIYMFWGRQLAAYLFG
jgi:leader peptidase (prepilin peptidase) / N-methyltransferase